MSIFDLFFKTRAEPEGNTNSSEQEGADTLLRASLSGDEMTRKVAMEIPAFAACVDKISDTISMIPIKLYREIHGRIEEVPADPRCMLLNDDTGDTLTGVQFKRAMVRDYLLGKGGYAYINRSGIQIKLIHYVKEGEISFLFNSDPIFKTYDITVAGRKYKPYEFLKILRNTDNGRNGTSIVDENSEVLNVAYHALLYEKNLVKTGGNKKGFIKSATKLSESALEKLKAAWRRMYQNNTENVVILNHGLEFQEASNTSVEMQLNENKKTNSTEIYKLFGMPAGMIEGKPTEADTTAFVQYCIAPILTEIECSLNRDLLLEDEKRLYFFAADTSELTKGDMEKRFRAYEIASKNGFLQIDEIRFRENLPPLGLDFVRLGLQDVLYDPKTRKFYMPNMNQTGGLEQETSDAGEGGETDEN